MYVCCVCVKEDILSLVDYCLLDVGWIGNPRDRRKRKAGKATGETERELSTILTIVPNECLSPIWKIWGKHYISCKPSWGSLFQSHVLHTKLTAKPHAILALTHTLTLSLY
jgi:hypothetical protein